MKGIILKVYADERINKELKECIKYAVADDEFDYRYDEKYGMEDFNILMENIDKILAYVESGYKGELRLNTNIWDVCWFSLYKIMKLYDLEWADKERRKAEENELVIHINKIGNIKKQIYEKMIKYGWHLGNNEMKDFNCVYNAHENFLNGCYDYKCEVENNNEILNMNDISVSNFEDMLDFMTDFLRALDEVDTEIK